MPDTFYVYVMASLSRRLYTGVTNDLQRRVMEHRTAAPATFTGRYFINRPVYLEETPSIEAAIVREKEIKGWLREKKLALIAAGNPKWQDLSSEWPGFEGPPTRV